ncbi:MAG: molybdopterin-dependent oxidoreductase [Desulfotomaculaceae bacterium]|nr:molybdopterin-dependent oxidoreductase [Desulfotomaculaceae bacterium]
MNNNDGCNRVLQAAGNRVALTNCGICNARCGMKITLAGSRIDKVEGWTDHPTSRGYLCPKGRAIKELVEAPDRLKSPLVKKPEGGWQEISWHEALDLVAGKINKLKENYGAEALAVHVGQSGVGKEFTHYAARFCQVYGTPNFSTAGSHCHYSRVMANCLTYGALPEPDFKESDCIVLWGSNPAESSPLLSREIKQARRQGAKLIVVDPRRTATAGVADLHLQLRPGTDGALALGLLRVVVTEGLYDREFVERWTVGFDRLAEHLAGFTPETAAIITGVPAAKIVEAARLYARSGPACISQGNALELHTNGFQAARAVAVLQAVTGNLDIAGGAVIKTPPRLASLIAAYNQESRKPAIGQNEFPLFYRHTRQAQANIYAEAILEGKPYPLRGMIVDGSNPALTWPNAGKVRRALAGLEFLAVIDHFMTATAALADIVIPVATFLGQDELADWTGARGDLRLGLIPGTAADTGQMTNWKFWSELACRMGYGDYFPWETEEAAINDRIKPLGYTVEELKQKPDGIVYGKWTPKKYEREWFKTASGKVELYSNELLRHGYEPLPVYREPGESPVSTPEVFSKYPFILTAGARTLGYFHSRYRNIPSLRQIAPEPLVEIHVDQAGALGIADGDRVMVESLRGKIELRAKLSREIHPGVILIPHGWAEANVNLLTDNDTLDPVTGFPACRSLLARVYKKD